jgi:hypothetical protein
MDCEHFKILLERIAEYLFFRHNDDDAAELEGVSLLERFLNDLVLRAHPPSKEALSALVESYSDIFEPGGVWVGGWCPFVTRPVGMF